MGGFDLDNLVNHGGGRYSAGSFGTYANGGNSVPYSPIELYFAGFIPPWEVPDLWVAKDGQWTDEQDASDNWIFSASDIETWSVQRIVAEHGARVPDWTRSQKSFRAAVVLLADEQFPATPTILRELADAVLTFGHPGPDSSRLFNFWEATGGRATLKMDDLRSGAIDADWAPVPVGSLASVRLAAGGAAGGGGRGGRVPRPGRRCADLPGDLVCAVGRGGERVRDDGERDAGGGGHIDADGDRHGPRGSERHPGVHGDGERPRKPATGAGGGAAAADPWGR